VGTDGGTAKGNPPKAESNGIYGHGINGACDILDIGKGRWPANLIHDGSDEVMELFPQTKKSADAGGTRRTALGRMNDDAWQPKETVMPGYGDSGSAARFFYVAKASKKDRDEGCEHLPEHQEGLQLPRGKCPDCGTWKNSGELKCKCGGEWQMTSNPPPKARNFHPTVKPTALMRYLCRLVTPPEGIVLDPFMGSGSTGKAAMLEGFQFVGIERDPEYFEIATNRIAVATPRQLEMAT
jgi:site-specific DNA-methyltransferase (adenine-specific)